MICERCKREYPNNQLGRIRDKNDNPHLICVNCYNQLHMQSLANQKKDNNYDSNSSSAANESLNEQDEKKTNFPKKKIIELVALIVLMAALVVVILFSTGIIKKSDDTDANGDGMQQSEPLPTYVLDDAVSEVRYVNGIFSMPITELMSRAISDCEVTYYVGEDAVAEGLMKAEIDEDLSNVYYAKISGNVMMSPSVPYYTQYMDKAIGIKMIFDDNGQFINYKLTLYGTLETTALIIMTD